LPHKVTQNDLLAQGILEAVPIICEDFLPLSAAGIFQSNFRSSSAKEVDIMKHKKCPDIKGFEDALRGPVLDMDRLYRDAQDASLRACALKLGIDEQALIE